jgi:hypothetical protein
MKVKIPIDLEVDDLADIIVSQLGTDVARDVIHEIDNHVNSDDFTLSVLRGAMSWFGAILDEAPSYSPESLQDISRDLRELRIKVDKLLGIDADIFSARKCLEEKIEKLTKDRDELRVLLEGARKHQTETAHDRAIAKKRLSNIVDELLEAVEAS